MSGITLAIFLLWVTRTIVALLPPLWWWQTKEYRWDRFWAAWKEGEGRGIFFGRLWFARIPLFAAALLVWPLLPDPDPIFATVAFALYLAEAFWAYGRMRLRLLPVPRFTARLSLIFLASVFILLTQGTSLALRAESFSSFVLSLIILDLWLPFIASISVAVTTPLIWLAKRRVITQTKLTRSAHPELIVVGITGSYGKTSTKEFAAELLSDRFRVFKTAEHENSEIPLARRVINICSELPTPNPQPLFIAEMGAYRKGEVRLVASFLKPSIGILTGLTDQHLALFGSREAILDTKWELAESLPLEGTLIFNADVPEFRERSTTFRGKVVSYGMHEEADVRATNIQEMRAGIRATIRAAGENRDVSLPLLGAFQLSNVLAAVALAHVLGVPLSSLRERISHLKVLPRTMELRSGPHGSTIIDDSYSANPEGVVAAIRFLRHFLGKKMVLMPSLIELGSQHGEVHRRIGRALAKLPADLAICIDRRAQASLSRGFHEAGGEDRKLLFTSEPQDVLRLLEPLWGSGSVLLIAGRIPERLYTALSKRVFL